MPPEPFNMLEMIGNIASNMQYAFTSCTTLREIHFPTLETILCDDFNKNEESGNVTKSFINMLNSAVGELV